MDFLVALSLMKTLECSPPAEEYWKNHPNHVTLIALDDSHQQHTSTSTDEVPLSGRASRDAARELRLAYQLVFIPEQHRSV